MTVKNLLYYSLPCSGHSNTGHVRYSYKYYQKGIIGNVTANGQVRVNKHSLIITEYEIFGEGSHISTNQKQESTLFSLLIG